MFRRLLAIPALGRPALASCVAGTLLGRWGLRGIFVDMRDPEALRRTMTPATRIVCIETPSNPLVAISDIERLTAIARAGGARSVVDNTWAAGLASFGRIGVVQPDLEPARFYTNELLDEALA